MDKGEVLTYSDDYEIIKIAKDYGTIPLLMISTLTQSGEIDLEVTYKILLTEEYQDSLFQNILNILQAKGYSGVNFILSDLITNNQNLYINFLTKISKRLNDEGYLLFVTINPNIRYVDNEITFEQIDYNTISKLVYRLTFFQYYWGINTNPPAPVSSIEFLKAFSDYLISITSLDNISIGKPVLAYDWALPFIQGKSHANSLSINSALTLANEVGATIQFDEASQTPFYYYNHSYAGEPENHIVWFIDARSIKALDDLIVNYGYIGSGIWNIMSFNQQMWTILISRFEIVKLIPDNLS
jgi:spore germination protein